MEERTAGKQRVTTGSGHRENRVEMTASGLEMNSKVTHPYLKDPQCPFLTVASQAT
jgi:hypothetical protein